MAKRPKETAEVMELPPEMAAAMEGGEAPAPEAASVPAPSAPPPMDPREARIAEIDARLVALGDPNAKLAAHSAGTKEIRDELKAMTAEFEKALKARRSEYHDLMRVVTAELGEVHALKTERAELES